MLLGERNVEAVVGGGGLQLEIERAAEAFAQREAPGFVDARAERRVNHQLHAAAFVEKALGDHGGLRGNGAQYGAAGEDVFDDLLGAGIVEAAFALEPVDRRRERSASLLLGACRGRIPRRASLIRFAQVGDAARRVPGCVPGASPRQKGTLGAAPCASSTRTVPACTRRMRQEVLPSSMMSPRKAFDGEILVHRADGVAFGHGDHGVERVFGNRAAAGDGREARAARVRERGRSRGRDAGKRA